MVLAQETSSGLLWTGRGHRRAGSRQRDEHALTKAEFDQRMPVEFWREVVDRSVAAGSPATLLLPSIWLSRAIRATLLRHHPHTTRAFMHIAPRRGRAAIGKVIKEENRVDPEISALTFKS